MDYVGLDPTVGLECTSCRHIVRLPYSELLDKVLDDVPMCCDGCGRPIEHDWTTVNIVQNIIAGGCAKHIAWISRALHPAWCADLPRLNRRPA
ncbi:MAG: hypothetical protein HC809_11560 [Gammaproteobacteria bacterium]|nr:hypothetical protein [Gammaproteobacteria bacterium]